MKWIELVMKIQKVKKCSLKEAMVLAKKEWPKAQMKK